VQQYSEGKLTLVMNPNDSLYYASDASSTGSMHLYTSNGFSALR
jgi:hypothetical protein